MPGTPDLVMQHDPGLQVSADQAALMNGAWLVAGDQQQLQQQQGLHPAYEDPSHNLAGHHVTDMVMQHTEVVVQHTELVAHNPSMLSAAAVAAAAAGIAHLAPTDAQGLPLMPTGPDMMVEHPADMLGQVPDVLMHPACIPPPTTSNGPLLRSHNMPTSTQQDTGWQQPSQSQSSSAAGDTSNPERNHQQQQSALRSLGPNTGSNAGNKKAGGARKPHLQGRFSGRLATKDDEKKLNVECRLLGPLLGGVGKRGDGSRLTLAKIVRGIAAGDVRKFCEERERNLKTLKQRIAQLEGTAQQTEIVKQENGLLRQQLMEVEMVVREGRALPKQPHRDIQLAGGGIDAPMPQAMDLPPNPPAAGVPLMMDTCPAGIPGVPTVPLSGSTHQAVLAANVVPPSQLQVAQAAPSMPVVPMQQQQEQQPPVVPIGVPTATAIRSVDSFNSSTGADAAGSRAGAMTVAPGKAAAAALAAVTAGLPDPMMMGPDGPLHAAVAPVASFMHAAGPAAAAGAPSGVTGAGYCSVASLPGATATCEGSMDGSGLAPLLQQQQQPLASGATAPISIPVRNMGLADPGMVGPSSLGTSPGLNGPSPGLVKSGMEDLVQTSAAAAAAASLPLVPGMSMGMPPSVASVVTAVSQPMAVPHSLAASAAGLPVSVHDPVAATTQVAAQVAQAAQAVQQQAQSLHAAAEIHAQKAQAATTQVQNLQATAQVIAQTHDELVKKIEDVKQTAVAQIQQPVVRHLEEAGRAILGVVMQLMGRNAHCTDVIACPYPRGS
eukprot:GHRR01011883.1.p1 GENE.GHRR01011883.1~~GHRR01011883.1.p1  ORF type:complete len:775 (+),score=340.56 GHRR01011883.1:847-3171(+)